MSHPPSERMSLYLDDDLAPEQRSAIDDHLERCPRCRDLVGDLRALKTKLGALEDRPPHRSLWPHIAEHLPRRSDGGPRWARRTAGGLLAAALVAAAGLAVWLRSDRPPGPDDAGSRRAGAAYADAADALIALSRTSDDHLLGALQQAIGDTRAALAQRAGDAFLVDHLERLERQRWRLLRSGAAWTAADESQGGDG